MKAVNSQGALLQAGGGGGGATFSGGFSTLGNTLGNTGLATDRLVLAGIGNITLSGSTNAGSMTVSISGAGGGLTNINVSAGTTSNNLSALTLSNANGVTFGLDGSTVTASVQTNYQTPGAYLTTAMLSNAVTLSNINVSAGTTSNNLSAFTLSNSNGLAFGLNGSTITGSYTVPSTAGLLSAVNLSAGTTSNNLSAFVLSNSNNVSFGLNGSTVTATATVASTQGSVNISAGTTSSLAASFVFSNSNNVSFGINGATVTATATVPAQSTQVVAVSAANGSATFSTLSFSDVNGISFVTAAGPAIQASHNALTSQSNQAFSAAGGSSAFQTLSFGDTNSVSWTNTGGSVGIASIKLQMFAVSNTTQNTSGTANHTALSFGGAGIASVGVTGGSVVISVPSGAPSPVNFSAGTTSGNLGSVVFSNSNGVSFGLNGSTITASAVGGGGIGGGISTFGNTAGSTGTVTTGNIVFVGSGPISLSGSTGAAGSAATISILGPATSSIVGENGISVSTAGSTITVMPVFASYYANVDQFVGTQTMSMLQSTSGMFPFVLNNAISLSQVRMILSGSVIGASSTGVTTGNSQFSGGHTRSHNMVIYTRGIGASSMSLQSLTSTQVTERFSFNCSAAAGNSTQFSYSLRYTFPAGGTASEVYFTKDYSSSAASLNFHTSQLTDLTGIKIVDFPFGISLSRGQYWLGYGISSTTASQYTAQMTRQGIVFTQFGVSQINSAFGTLGSGTNSSVNPQPGLGSYSVAGGGTSASINLTQLSSSASQNHLYFQFMRIA